MAKVLAAVAFLILVNNAAAILEKKSTAPTDIRFDAYTKIEAELSNTAPHISVYNSDNVTFVGNLQNGGYLEYFDVEFADGAVGMSIRISTSDVQPGSLIQIDFRMNSLTAPVFHTISVGPTRGSATYNWMTVTEYFLGNRPAGTWDVYLEIRDVYGRCCPLFIDWFQFF